MKIYFTKLDSNTWRLHRFYDGDTIYHFKSEQHWKIQATIKNIFSSATFLTGKHVGTCVKFADAADEAFFNIWANDDGLEI